MFRPVGLTAALLLFRSSFIHAQNLPDEWHLAADGRTLTTNGQEVPSGLYREDTVRTIYLAFAAPRTRVGNVEIPQEAFLAVLKVD